MEPFRIISLKVKDIGPFGNLDLTFMPKPDSAKGKAEVHIFTGENGTGKSTLLEVLASTFRKEHTTDPIGNKSRNNGSKVEIIIADDDHGSRRTEYIYADGQWEFSFAVFAYSGYRQIRNAQIKGIQEIEQHPLADALDFNRANAPQLMLQWVANTIAAEAIASVQQEPKNAAQRRLAIQQLEAAIGKICEKKIEFKLETSPYAVKIALDGEVLDFNQLPDGLKSIISWLADLLMRMERLKWENDTPVLERNFILLLDEIEVHLHPSWQRKILPAVQSLFPNAQIFISTHSPFVIGSVDDAWIYKLVKPNGDSHLEQSFPVLSNDNLSYEHWLEEVFGIREKYGPQAQLDYERRQELLRKKDISAHENEELSHLDAQFGLIAPDETPLGQRIVEHLKKLKSA